MPSSLLRALGALSDPAVRRVLWLGILGAVAGFLLVAGAAWFLLLGTELFAIGWLDSAVDVLGGIAALFLAYLMFPAIVVAVSSLLLDDVVAAVERRHYPRLPPARSLGLARSIWLSLRFLGVVVGLNLLALPVYVFIPALNLVVFYLLNGYLLGREYFELVAFRRMPPEEAAVLRRRHGLRLFWAGLAIAFLSTIPVVNLLVPVLASAFMAHVFYFELGFGRAVAQS
jgi:CysZ protein